MRSNILTLQSDPAAFRAALLIDSDSGPRPFRECCDEWQAADFAALDNGWRAAIGQQVVLNTGQHHSRGWLERPRGHSKSADVMTMATWALFAARKQLAGVVAAVDREQASLDRDQVARLVSANPWLANILDITAWRITNKHTGSTLEIMASDVASSYGLLIDFAVCDEVTLWAKRDLFDSILSASAKRANCILLCIGNAGFTDSWQYELRNQIRSDPRWYFSRLDGPVASWISKDALAEQERLLPRAAYERLWLNVWSAGSGDALSPADIAAAFDSTLQRTVEPSAQYDYVAGLDIGISRDASAVCVLGVRRDYQGHGRIELAHTRVWRPSSASRVDLQQVEDTLFALHKQFNFKQLNYDPWQATHMASRLQSAGFGRIDGNLGLPMIEITPTATNLQRMATVLIEAFADRRLRLYEEPDLRRDLTHMRIVERSYGFRLESPRDATGHGDLGNAFALGMLAASELAAKPRIVLGDYLSPKPQGWEQRLRDYQEEQQQAYRDMYPSESESLRDALRAGRVHFGQPMTF